MGESLSHLAKAVHKPAAPEMVEQSRDAALIRAARSGQASAFNQFVQAYEGLMYNLAFWIVGDPQTAIDVTQGTFLRAAQRFSRLRQGSAKLWLMRILVEICRDRLSRLQPQVVPGLIRVLVDDRQAIPGHAPREYQDKGLQAHINGLSLEQRIVLVLSDVGHLNYREIAASTGVSVKIVRSRLGQGRAGLRDALWAKGTLLSDTETIE
jgi:RNA polymerase sigma-70 factor (ECF subfamily)